MVFVDGIVLTRKFDPRTPIKQLCGLRMMAFREPGDIDREGKTVEETEVVGERMGTAWIHGSHDSRLQLRSDGNTLSLKGNPGRWGRADNLFNLGFEETIAKANAIVHEHGFPEFSFVKGVRDAWTESQLQKLDLKPGQEPEDPWTGARVWSIHLTQNYVTGSPENAKAVIDWLDTQSVARVKKSRLGATTIVWGSIRYCQTEVYVKADEMLAHCKNRDERAQMLQSEAYKYAFRNGIIRLEVKCAKDFLKERNLTFLGNWDMGTVTKLFKEKASVLERVTLSYANDDELLQALPSHVRVHAAAWLSGVDVTKLMSRATFYRHSKVLREHGIDISEPRNIAVIRPKMREIMVEPVTAPSWYSLQVA
jgi:hypothetical protein